MSVGASLVAHKVMNAGDSGSIPGLGRSPWRRAWQPTSVFLPGDSMDRGAWQATAYRVAKELDTTERRTLLLLLLVLCIC